MKLLDRKKNVVNSKTDLKILHVHKKFPVFMGCVKSDIKKDLKKDMEWSISKETGIIQLSKLIPLKTLYKNNHNSGVVGGIWSEHHKQFAKFINKFKPKSVLEIGGGHGILSREANNNKKIKWIIVEPNPSPAKKVNTKFIKGFFDENFKMNEEIDTIVHSHVFEHVYYPSIFLQNISKYLKKDQKLIFSIPNMKEMLKRKYTNCLNFEHTFFITEPYIEYLMSKNGFKKISKKYFKEDHSIFYSYIKDPNCKSKKLPKNLYIKNKNIFMDYINYYKKLVSQINTKIKKTPKNSKIYLFGAHIFSQYLIESDINIKKIIYLLDNDKEKQNKRLYGTKLLVKSPKILRKEKEPIVILKAGVYNNEIKKDILNNINSSVIFWE